ncbi:hypothetical protein F5884DRAFT_681956 [Xylogone sp. PMI_703]|nr:hypothetical protein F5884DRAFT_681956 [Xylogone sp. PMI_703]
MPDPKIAIIGAGISGLALAKALDIGGIPFTIYEKDTSRYSRKQGGLVSLDYDSGERVLRVLGLFEKYEKELVTPGCEVTSRGSETGELYLHHSNLVSNGQLVSSVDSPLTSRIALRNLLLDSIPVESIKWASKLDTIVSSQDKYDLKFTDGSVVKRVDLIVGADGAWSKVRSMLTDVKPFYTGLSYMETTFTNIPNAPDDILKHIERGSYFYTGCGACLALQRDGERSIWVYAILEKPESWVKNHGFDLSNMQNAKREFVERDWSKWNEKLKACITESDTELIPRSCYMLPVGTKWEPSPGITLLGDAAHLMTPFAGAGANMALEDGLELGEFILGARRRFHWLDQKTQSFCDQRGLAVAIHKYETTMFPRTTAEAARTVSNKDRYFAKNSVDKFIDLTHTLAKLESAGVRQNGGVQVSN